MPVEAKVKEVMSIVAAWLRHSDRRGWLVVLDNADNEDVLKSVVSDLLPAPADGAHTRVRGDVVVTSRLSPQALSSLVPGIQSRVVTALATADAEALLLHNRDPVPPDEAGAVRELAGPAGLAGLPLALTHAAAAVAAGTTYASYAAYLQAFRAKRTALFAEGSSVVQRTTPVREWLDSQRPRWPSDMVAHVVETLEAKVLNDFEAVRVAHDVGSLPTLGLRPVALGAVRAAVTAAADANRRCVSTTLELSMENASDAAGAAMRVLSLTAADAVPMALLETAARHVDGLAAAGDDGATAGAMRAAVSELHRLSLVTATETTVSVHRVVQAVVRDGLAATGTAHGDAVVKATAACVPDPEDTSLAPSAWLPWLPHVEAVVSIVDAGVGTHVSASAAKQEAADALLSGIRGHMMLGCLDLAQAWLDRLRGASAAVPDLDDLRRAAAAASSGSLLWRSGSLEAALAAHEEALALRRKVWLPRAVALIASSLNDVAIVLSAMGRYDDALARHEEALTIKRAWYSGAHASVAVSLSNIGVTLNDLGRHDEALASLEKALEMRRACLPAVHPSIANSLNNIGFALRGLGRYNEALSMFEQALAIDTQCFPAGHTKIAGRVGGIGFVLHKLGRHAEALDKMQEALEMFRAALPPTHKLIVVTMKRMEPVLTALGREADDGSGR